MRARIARILPIVLVVLVVGNLVAFARAWPEAHRIRIKSPAAGAQLAGNTVVIDLGIGHLKVARADGSRKSGVGHPVVYVDHAPVGSDEQIERRGYVINMPSTRRRLYGLTLGKHKLTVVLADGANHRVGSARASVTFTVKGPTVVARVLGPVREGAQAHLKVNVEGVELSPPGPAGPKPTGHLHIFIDAKPPTAGSVNLPGNGVIDAASGEFLLPVLPKGPHRAWVVLADNNHVNVKPLVIDEVAFVVGGSG